MVVAALDVAVLKVAAQRRDGVSCSEGCNKYKQAHLHHVRQNNLPRISYKLMSPPFPLLFIHRLLHLHCASGQSETAKVARAVAAEIAERQRSGTEEASLSDEPSRTQRSESERSSKREHQPFARLDDALHGCCNAFARF